jgi:hypothetical protein
MSIPVTLAAGFALNSLSPFEKVNFSDKSHRILGKLTTRVAGLAAVG